MTAFHTIAIPHDDTKKELIEAFLAERDRVEQEVEKSTEQGKLL